MTRLSFAILLGAVAVAPAWASHTGLPMPQWIDVAATVPAVPEVDKPFTIRANVKVLLGKMENGRYLFRLPPGAEIVSGEVDGKLTLAAGESKEITIQAKLHKASPDSSAGLDVIAPYPREEMLKEIERVYADRPPEEIDALHRRLDNAKGDQTFSSIAAFSAAEEEGLGSAEEPAFLHYFRAAGSKDVRFAMLAPRSEPPPSSEGVKAGAARDLFARNPKLAELFKKAGKDPEALSAAAEVDDYSRAVRGLEAGKLPEALASFRAMAADAAKPAMLRVAAANAEAVTLFAQGKAEAAEEAWTKMASLPDAGPLARYAYFNLGESLRSRGKQSEAVENYKKAVELRPAFTLARRRLSEK